MSNAWHAGVVAKCKDTPPLRQLLGEQEPIDPKVAMQAALKSWVAATTHLGSASATPSESLSIAPPETTPDHLGKR